MSLLAKRNELLRRWFQANVRAFMKEARKVVTVERIQACRVDPTTADSNKLPPGAALMNESSTSKPSWPFWLFCVGSVVGFIIYKNSAQEAPISRPAAVPAKQSRTLTPREIEEACATRIQTELQPALEKNKQELFNAFHPIGTAKRLVLHDVAIGGWKHGNVSGRPQDILQFTTRFTIYWEGPITKDGFTKVAATWDCESQRWLPGKILATNGVTNSQAADAFIGVAGAVLLEAIRDRAN
jgi:hypothetical protein